MKILIATHNPSKLKEIKAGLSDLEGKGVQLLSLENVSINSEPEETGKTFQENSLLKVRYYSQLTRFSTIADDGGLGINILNGKPGVISRRWKGYEMTDKELIDYTLEKLKAFRGNDRSAYLQTCITFYDPQTKTTFFELEKIEGAIGIRPSGRPTEGYPFRALFIVKKFNKYYDELTEDEHKKINHRLIALKRLAKKIESYLLQ
ncbi:hypothetical protein HY041_02220 [Candidatus Roizmanbacteria bacterium]|nr:hypothetical protein [Candidatus Roizmanbacteria bacterium]